MKRGGALLALFVAALCGAPLFASGGAEQAARCVIDTGHVGAVRSLAFDGRTGLLVSGGDDGTLRFWDAATRTIVRTLKVTRLSLARIAVDPTGPRVAAVITDGTGAFQLSVWSWEEERELYRVPLKESPLFLRYGASGGYLLYGVSSWQSLTILHASDGSAYEFHPEGFGIVGFAEMSRSEKTLMTYSLAGRITYWDLASGQPTVDVPSVPYLSALAISADRRYIAGSTGAEVDIIDAVTGAMKSRVPVSGAVSLDFSPAGDEIACLTAGSGAATRAGPGAGSDAAAVSASTPGAVSRWSFAGPVGVQTAPPRRIAGTATLVAWGPDALFASTLDGPLVSLPAAGEPVGFGANVLAGVTGFDAGGGALVLASRDWVRVFSSDMLSGVVAPTYISTQLRPNPLGGPVGVGLLPDGRLLAWRSDSSSPHVSVASAAAPSVAPSVAAALATPFVPLPAGFQAALVGLRPVASTLVGIEAGGTVRLVDLATGMSRFDVRVPGVSTAVQTGPVEIVAGRNSSATDAGSLLRVNTVTGETVTVKDRNVFTWGLILDTPDQQEAPVLYSVGVDASGATNLLLHDGAGFDHETLLDSVPTEDLDAGMSLDPSTHRLFAIVGRDRIVRWDGKQLTPLALRGTSALRLLARDNLLFVLNRDGTVTVSSGDTGESFGEIALFADGEWAALLRDGKYAASTGGDVRVRVFVGGAPVKATEDFRVRIPVQ
ncbi:MAG TPA: WD40 repeat domain-containing protein [Spirochaetia bacterium]